MNSSASLFKQTLKEGFPIKLLSISVDNTIVTALPKAWVAAKTRVAKCQELVAKRRSKPECIFLTLPLLIYICL